MSLTDNDSSFSRVQVRAYWNPSEISGVVVLGMSIEEKGLLPDLGNRYHMLTSAPNHQNRGFIFYNADVRTLTWMKGIMSIRQITVF